MKPEMSTAVMIERIREMATDSSDSQDRVLLSSVANRIELLLAAESGMSLEMACIRHALDIPLDQSVQSGVVNEFVRLNAKIQDLSGQLAELGRQEPVAIMVEHEGHVVYREARHTHLYDIPEYQITPLYARPFPQAVSQLIIPNGLQRDTAKLVTDFASALAEKLRNAELKYGYNDGWSDDSWSEQCLENFHQHIAKGDPRDVAAYCAFMWYHGWKTELPAIQHYTVPDGWVLVPAKANAAMVSAAGRAAREYIEEYGGNNPQVIYQAMLNAAPQLDRKDGDA